MTSETIRAKNVLLCGHEGLLVLSTRKTLARAGYNVVGEAQDGPTALKILETAAPDMVLILDVRLPGPLDGIALTREIMARRRLPVVLLSASAEEADVDAALDAGACGYLLKPITSEHLLPALLAACSRFHTLQTAIEEATELREYLETRKLVERAKGLLMGKPKWNLQLDLRPVRKIRFNH